MSFGRPSLPRIETDYSEPQQQEFQFSLDTTSPFTPISNRASDLPTFRLSTSNDTVTQDEISRPPKPSSTNRARDEGRKLLAHVLTQLRGRSMPPSVPDAIGTLHEDFKHDWNFKDAVKLQRGSPERGQRREEDSDNEEKNYSTDATFYLMLQLQETLVMSLEQRWDIFDDSGCGVKIIPDYYPLPTSVSVPLKTLCYHPTAAINRRLHRFVVRGAVFTMAAENHGLHLQVEKTRFLFPNFWLFV